METNPYAAPQATFTTEEPMPLAAAAPALWNPNAAGLWSLLFSPVFGSILILKNWAAIGDRNQVLRSRTWLLASLVSSVLQIYGRWWALPYIILWYLGFQRKQTEYVAAHWGAGYPRKSFAVPLLLALVAILLLSTVSFVLTR